jgi:hypothetical protein
MEEIIGGRRKLHSVESPKLSSSRNIVRKVQSRKIKFMAHVTHMRGVGDVFKRFALKLRGREQLEVQGLAGRKILNRIVRKWILRLWTRILCSGMESGGTFMSKIMNLS